MPGLRGTNRVPGGTARLRRNFNAAATAFEDRSLGNGLTLDSLRLLTIQVATSGGLTVGAGGLSILLDPDADNKLSLSAAGLAANITGGDGIDFPGQEISVNLTDNTIMAKVGAAAAGPLAMANNTVLLRRGADIEAFLMPHVFDTSGSILVRDGNNPTTDIKALVVGKNKIIQTNSAGNWIESNFAPDKLIVSDALGGLATAALGSNRWVISDSGGGLTDLVAITDWMLVGVANAPAFLISAANALVGKFGMAATAFNVVAANTLVGRLASGTDLNDLAVGVQQLMLRGAGDMAATTIDDTRWVGRPVGGDLGAVTPAESRVMLGLKYISYMTPVGLYVDRVTTITTYPGNETYFMYVGKAGAAFTTANLILRVTTAYAAGTWAEVGVFTGAFVPNGGASLTRRGFADVSSIINSTGIKNISITGIGGISEGDDIWIAIGTSSSVVAQYRGMHFDNIQSGSFQMVAGQLSGLSTPVSTAIEAGEKPVWCGLAI